jgi:DNA-binding response OmpR family regulator
VLSDINLPGASGMGLCLDILKLRPTQLVALLSGYVSENDRVLARKSGIRHVLEKPMTVAQTIRMIEKMFEQPDVEVHLHERPRRRAGLCR